MLTVKELREGIRLALAQFTVYVRFSVSQDMTDINRYAEDFYCELLNTAFGWKLRNLNQDNRNQPAIDLADDTNKIAVQVTSSTGRSKITSTLKKFFDGNLDQQYDSLIFTVIGEEDTFAKDFTLERSFDFNPQRDIWDTPRLLNKLESIGDLSKLQAIYDYLRDQLKLYPFPMPQYPTLPLRTTLEGDAFIGRAGELAEIDRRFRSERVLFLTGLGGMGKTELAVRYAREYVEKRGHWAFLVLFRGDLRQTLLFHVAPTISGLDTKTLPESEILRRTVEALNSSGADSLLILDNADQANLTALRRELSVLKLKVLVTTRLSGGRDGILTPRLSNEELYKLFDRHGADISQPQRDALIDAVAGHTMTVDMIAQTLVDEWCNATAEDICAAMKGSEMDEDDYPEIEVAHNSDPEQRKIYGHLRALFRLQDMKEEEKQALRCAVLLPPEGMHNQLFRKALPEACRGSIERLQKRGWVQSENKLLTIHPVVQLVCRRELSPTVENCDGFLQWFRGQYDRKTYDTAKFSQIAALYEAASEVLRETDGFWANAAGYLWLVLMESRRALTCNQRAVALLEQNAPNSQSLATAYNNLGSTYGHLGDHEKELEYQLKALAIKEQVLPPTHPSLATSYNNVGSTYLRLGEHEKALEYLLKALLIREQILPPTHPDLATSYNNVGSTYGHLGDHKKELEYQLKALAIREQVLPPNHPSLATSYNNVGTTYGDLGDHKKALEYKLKDLAICEQVLPPTHPELATSYNNVGMTYGYLGDHKKALEYQLKALAIKEQVLPPTHPSLATSYNNVGSTYGHLGDREKELEYQLKALGIQEQSLPPDHPDIVMCRSNIAITYAQLEDFIRANEYMRRALDSAERSMGNHPQLEMYRQAAQIMELCAMFQEAGMPLPFDNPFQ